MFEMVTFSDPRICEKILRIQLELLQICIFICIFDIYIYNGVVRLDTTSELFIC